MDEYLLYLSECDYNTVLRLDGPGAHEQHGDRFFDADDGGCL